MNHQDWTSDILRRSELPWFLVHSDFYGGIADNGVDLGTAVNYVILSKSGISTAALASTIKGDIAVSPIAAGAITGFALIMDSSNEFSTDGQVEGNIYAADYTPPSPSKLTIAVLNMQAAYIDARDRPSDAANLNVGSGGDIGGMTLTTGVYKFNQIIKISSSVYFSGSETDVFIIQTTGSITQDVAANVILQGSVKAENIFWQVAKTVEVGAGSTMEGIILAAEKVTFITGSKLNGRILSQTAVILQSSEIRNPRCSVT
jgi:cytoskeletal protein CcmA (bactofilin family)